MMGAVCIGSIIWDSVNIGLSVYFCQRGNGNFTV